MGDMNCLGRALDAVIVQELGAAGVPGAVLLVTSNGVIVHEKAYGQACSFSFGPSALAEPEPMTVGHLFDLGSLTKVFATTFGIMLLLDAGLVNLADRAARFLPIFSGQEKGRITLRALLNHTSGLASWLPLYYHAANRDEALRYIAAQPLAGPVGSSRTYSDLGFMVLAGVIEAVSGRRSDVFLDEQLYGPLGLTDTAFLPLTHGFTRIVATSHGNPYEQRMISDPACGFPCLEKFEDFTKWRQYTLHGEVNDGNVFYCFNGVAGHAGLFGTAGAVLALVRFLLDLWQGRASHPYLQTADLRAAVSRANAQAGSTWGLGFDTPSATQSSAG